MTRVSGHSLEHEGAAFKRDPMAHALAIELRRLCPQMAGVDLIAERLAEVADHLYDIPALQAEIDRRAGRTLGGRHDYPGRVAAISEPNRGPAVRDSGAPHREPREDSGGSGLSRAPHQAKAHLVMRSIAQVEVARELHCSSKWVNLCLNGRVKVPDRFKTGIAAILDLPVDECFRDGGEAA